MKRLRVTVIAGFVVPLLAMVATLVGGAGQIVRIGRIFEKFYRARVSEMQRHGSGVGLALVRHIVDAHGGDV